MKNNADRNILKENGKAILLLRIILTALIIIVGGLGFFEIIPAVLTVVSLMVITGLFLLYRNHMKS